MLRTHTCGELRKEHAGSEVTLSGWIRSIRDHNHFAFVNLTDRYGFCQVYFDENLKPQLEKEAYVQLKGEVKARPEKEINPNMATGEIEVICKEMKILSRSKVLPFELFDKIDVKEETRLKYRFLDMRRPQMIERLTMRSKIASAIRKAFEEMSFLEVETPVLVRSTPEGSRDFVVPSRVHHGKFYALPQSPQLYKQMLMIGGLDRYYQFARCFRDEDARRDRQLVHTQVDVEMATTQQEDVFRAVEHVMKTIFSDVLDVELKTPFPTYTYDEVMARFGIDKPDMRFGMELIDCGEAVSESGFVLFENALKDGATIKGIVAPGCAAYSRKQVSKLEKYIHQFQAKGLVAFKVKDGKLEGSPVKKMSEESVQKLYEKAAAQDGDLLLLCVGKSDIVHRSLGELRNYLARELNLIPEGEYNFLWVIDFPLFEWDEEANSWTPMHHMFSMPKDEFIENFEENPGDVKAQLYDLVLNGVELGSGSIRISYPEIQKRVMNLVGMSEEEAQKKFGFLLDAYQYASPPHGGIGMGFDNLVMTMLQLENIREVIAYPNASNGMFLYDGSPTPIECEQLDELHLNVVEKEEDEEANNEKSSEE
ncbi:aspartate--tRNA ligase [Candidatus Uabimicrobium amorphum]|uniref:Aspartate--tRNA(Asp/Asn) ligase n=1 Tax=Uabimicrobium amorphum TaxID=2596890 RepID=A0A5S9F502_UABAM|nr:aspartate--tRNA ligase [Candidatus Uabimicrobium amorphum]BBM85149.1 aspartate--tRNA(Asp/Asn) ligase [Candidatus Uabimicrobium amorphum]